nr:phosphotransferase [Devosia naphthalenivorans]
MHRQQLLDSSSGAGFGYASRAAEAPHASWTDVVRAHVERSRGRIVVNGLFSATAVDQVSSLLTKFTARLHVVEPVLFLHDTTTKNVIVSPEGYLSGIVDVDDLCYGDARYPAALTAAALLDSGGPSDYVHAWLAHAEQAWTDCLSFM